MFVLDAFRAFDSDRDGLLSCSELYGGLDWLGLTDLVPEQVPKAPTHYLTTPFLHTHTNKHSLFLFLAFVRFRIYFLGRF